MTRWGTYVEQRLSELENGDGDFTELRRPSAATVQHARTVAAGMFRDGTPTPSVVPTEDGEVAFVWHRNGCDAEIEVDETSAWFWMYDRATTEVNAGMIIDRDDSALLLDRIADEWGGDPAMSMPESFTCCCCGIVSYHPMDVAQRFCGRCCTWPEDPLLGPLHMDGPCPWRRPQGTPVPGDDRP